MHQPVEQKDNPIMLVRMTSGEDLVSEVVYKDNNGCMLNNPLKISYGMGSSDEVLLIAFSHWVVPTLCDKQSFEILSRDLLFIAPPTKRIVDCYIEAIKQNEFARLEEEALMAHQNALRSSSKDKASSEDSFAQDAMMEFNRTTKKVIN